MILNWQMPRYREPLWIELIIDASLKRINTLISAPLRGTCLDYYLLDAERQVSTTFLTILLASLIWVLWLTYSIRAEKRRLEAQRDEQRDGADVAAQVQLPHDSENEEQSESESERAAAQHTTPTISDDATSSPAPSTPTHTPFMRRLAPPGHVPTNAQLFAPRPSHGASERTGRPLSPGYQTPVAPELEDRPQLRSFKKMRDVAPVSWGTLREMEMLDGEGTPTGKWREGRFGGKEE